MGPFRNIPYRAITKPIIGFNISEYLCIFDIYWGSISWKSFSRFLVRLLCWIIMLTSQLEKLSERL